MSSVSPVRYVEVCNHKGFCILRIEPSNDSSSEEDSSVPIRDFIPDPIRDPKIVSLVDRGETAKLEKRSALSGIQEINFPTIN